MPENHPLEGLESFLLENIESYAQLECLLALATRPELEWKVDLVAETIRLSPAETRSALDHLVRRRLLVASPDIENPSFGLDRDHHAFVVRLDRLYRSQTLLIVRLMNANALERVRHEAAKTFSDAFLIRKKKPDG
jgi:hypothetical protein